MDELAKLLKIRGSYDEAALTRRWLEKAHRASRRLYRSPPYAQPKPLPLEGEALYTYERSLWPTPLENTSETVICRNLQAAYWTGLVSLRDMLDRPLSLRSFGLSRPLQELLHLLDSPRLRWSAAFSQTTFDSSAAGQRDHLYLADAAVLDTEGFVRAWAERGPAQAVVWLDVTSAPRFDWQAFQAALQPAPWLLVRARGWQAWDTHGLDLCRPGELWFHSPPSEDTLSPAATAAELARRVRSVLGVALSLAELSECCLPRLDRTPLFQNWERVAAGLGRPLDPDGSFHWPSGAAAPGILPGDARGALQHRFQPEGEGLRVTVGWSDPQPVLDLLSRSPQPERSIPEPPAARRRPRSPQNRKAILRLAESRPPLSLDQLEERLLAYEQPPSGWVMKPLLMRSGMAALAAIWLALERLLPPPLKVTGLGSYFESTFLSQVMQGGGTVEVTPEADILFAESVSYDWELTPLDPGRLRRARGLVLDTTLTGQKVTLAQLVHPKLEWAIRFFSGLKLDQAGLELENCGAVLVVAPPQIAETLHRTLREARRVTGNLPTPLERQRLSPTFVLDAEVAADHAEKVFDHNRRLAQNLAPTRLLRRAVHHHPCPFVVLHLRDSGIDQHRRLTAALVSQARRRKLDFVRGASFGFVHHRHEFIIPVLKENRALFKVAMGSSDPRPVIELLLEVLAAPSLPPRLAPPPRDWSAPSSRLLRYLEGPP